MNCLWVNFIRYEVYKTFKKKMDMTFGLWNNRQCFFMQNICFGYITINCSLTVKLWQLQIILWRIISLKRLVQIYEKFAIKHCVIYWRTWRYNVKKNQAGFRSFTTSSTSNNKLNMFTNGPLNINVYCLYKYEKDITRWIHILCQYNTQPGSWRKTPSWEHKEITYCQHF